MFFFLGGWGGGRRGLGVKLVERQCASLSVPWARRVTSILHLPLEILPCHLVEHIIKGLVELVQSADDIRLYFGVYPALGLAKAPRGAAVLRLLQAGEAFGLVEVEVLVGDDALETQEILHLGHFTGRIRDEPLAAHKVHL